MKFFKKFNNDFYNNNSNVLIFGDDQDFFYIKKYSSNRKYLNKSRKNVLSISGKNALIREKSFNFFQKFLKLNTKKGQNQFFFKSFNVFLENLFILFINDENKINCYYKYNFFKNELLNNKFIFNENDLFLKSFNGLESIFEIKTKKITKKMNIKSNNKYLYELVYNTPQKRFKYILRNLKSYLNNFKNYSLNERLFWALINSFMNTKNSFLNKKKLYTHVKSVKFFKRNKKK